MRILIADDEPAARYALKKALQGDGREFIEAADGKEVLQCLRDQACDLVFLDLNMPLLDGLSVLKALQLEPSILKPEIIVLTANDTIANAIECIRYGAADFIAKPYDVEHMRSVARRSHERVRLQQQIVELQLGSQVLARFGTLLGASPAMRALYVQIERAAGTDLPVLLRGESGTGKELVAREIHQRSARTKGPMVAINTAAISESLIESELFGHSKGAFTGAERAREGVFRQANGGTLFLDEIGDMPFAVQTRLLRVLQESEVQPVGAEQPQPIDVRVVSATHQDLEQAIVDKAFRQDLYYRLKGIELSIPPLRCRQEDILLLARSFSRAETEFSGEAVSSLLAYTWPGNVRELKQRIQAAVAMADSNRLTPADLGLAPASASRENASFESYMDMPLAEAHQRLLEDFDRMAVARALAAEDGNITSAAKRLGMHRQSLQQKIKTLGIR
jgi:DNA-binding NtrC family response regulator